MITRFQVHNYKALRNVTLDLTPVHVLIGPNDSGKTSVLEAISALCRSAVRHGRTAAEFAGAWKGQQLVWKGQADLPVKFGVVISDAEGTVEYELACLFVGENREIRVTEEKLREGAVLQWRNLPSQTQSSSALSRLDDIGRNLPSEDLKAARRVQEALSGVHLYRWNPRFLSLPVAPDSSRQFLMESSGFGLALVLDDILGFDRNRFTELENRFRQIFPDIKSIKLVREMAYRAPVDPHQVVPQLQAAEGKGLQFEFLKTGQTLPASQVSDGVLLVLAYLTILHLPEPPRVILVEEPENGIHPKRLDDVLRLLRDLVAKGSRSQIVMTTHSPYLVDLFQPEEVSLCRREPDGSASIHNLSKSKMVRDQLDIFSLGEIWTAEGEDEMVRAETKGPEDPE